MAPASARPLILTLQMDGRLEGRFDRLRQMHFPPERNYLNADLSLWRYLGGPWEPVGKYPFVTVIIP